MSGASGDAPETLSRDTGEPPQARRAGPTDITDPLIRTEARKAFVWIGMLLAFALVVFLSQSLLVIFGGIVFGALLDGGARLLRRVLPIGRTWCVGIVLLLALLALTWIARFAGSQIATQAAELPATIEGQYHRALAWLAGRGIHLTVIDLRSMLHEAMGGIGQFTAVVGGLIGGLTTLFLILVLGIYFALEPRLYRRGVGWMLPVDRRDHFEGTSQIMGAALRRLLFGRVIGMSVEGVFTWVMLQVYGVPMAALLGLITGLLAFLPNIGAPISGAVMVLVGFSGGVEMGLYTLFVYLMVHLIDGYIIVPMIARKTVDLPPALVLAAQLIMGVLFGILGLALADPLVGMIKIWLEREAARNGHANGHAPSAQQPAPHTAPEARDAATGPDPART
ncbi:AI-2E family transporter [Novosphingobium sp. 1949]|uniref:AI-2E family transporter n=1 Tax=Novosphingobium organovorum TaxID=2930092 RepID=A0ABT0BDN1_9SPHN|nr:AI-2E family transporter [Novosphingobium organovorum]MCJ2183175.1 AI-2E family transporter [Novosphingobium organovorum]